MRSPASVLVLGGVAAVAAVSALAAGNLTWNRATAKALRRLEVVAPRRSPAEEGGISPGLFDDLPAPVRRYFEFALAPGQGMILRAHVRQDGVMRSGSREDWKPFSARETLSAEPIGFVWDAKLQAFPALSVRVREEYAAGRGASEASLGGLVRVAAARGTPETASASLLRYLAESPWLPTALLPRAGVRWSAIDERNALATLTDAGTTVSMKAQFGERGEIIGISATRARLRNGRYVPTPWFAHLHGYSRFDGMMIPTSAEVEWRPPEGSVSVWRGYVLSAEYEFEA